MFHCDRPCLVPKSGEARQYIRDNYPPQHIGPNDALAIVPGMEERARTIMLDAGFMEGADYRFATRGEMESMSK